MRSTLTISSRSPSASTAATSVGSGTKPNRATKRAAPQHPQRVVGERDLRRERRAQPAGGEVGGAVVRIDEHGVGEAQRHAR